jgi:phosphate starvation-inducible protein PhoH
VPGISRVDLDDKDIIRHKLVSRIVAAYKKQEDRDEQSAD